MGCSWSRSRSGHHSPSSRTAWITRRLFASSTRPGSHPQSRPIRESSGGTRAGVEEKNRRTLRVAATGAGGSWALHPHRANVPARAHGIARPRQNPHESIMACVSGEPNERNVAHGQSASGRGLLTPLLAHWHDVVPPTQVHVTSWVLSKQPDASGESLRQTTSTLQVVSPGPSKAQRAWQVAPPLLASAASATAPPRSVRAPHATTMSTTASSAAGRMPTTVQHHEVTS